MEIKNWYTQHFEDALSGRYITMQRVKPLLEKYKLQHEISVVGKSELGQDIPMIKIGQGKTVVLGWSQMHGNEATTTKAVFDFIKLISQKQYYKTQIERFLATYTLYVIPMLNPDGSERYTRENANGVDLNRDAQALSQSESLCLHKVFTELKPSLCLNLHDQRSIYGFKDGKAATVSFLAPAANPERTITDARKVAMQYIVKMNAALQEHIPGQVGRYDDSFNEACVGDTFQKAGVPTILFEAGHYKQDYQREKTREFIFYSLVSLFSIIDEDKKEVSYKAYFDIPENLKNYNDIILRNVKLEGEEKLVSMAIQYKEILKNDAIIFEPFIDEIHNLQDKHAFVEKNSKEVDILTNLHKKLTIGVKISKIINRCDKFVIYFY